MRRSSPPVCPQCGRSDRIEKVYTLYQKGSEGGRLTGLAGRLAPKTGIPGQPTIPPVELQELTRKLSPPTAMKNSKARLIHPDYAIGAFSVALPVFLIGILTSRAILLAPILFVVGGFYAFYFKRRPSLLSRFENKRLAHQENLRRSERAMGRWLSACYCSRDHVFFLAGRPTVLSLAQLAELLKA